MAFLSGRISMSMDAVDAGCQYSMLALRHFSWFRRMFIIHRPGSGRVGSFFPLGESMNVLITSLRLRALILTILAVIGMSVAYTLNASRLVLEAGLRDVDERVHQTAEVLNLVSAPFTSTEGEELLRTFLETMLSREKSGGLVYIVILSDTGSQIVSAGNVPHPFPSPDTDIHVAALQGIVHAANPILLRGNRVGTLQFGLSTQQMLATRSAIVREGVMISLAIGGSLVALVLVVGYLVGARIKGLVLASQAIASGDYDGVRADERGRDEISLLSHNFNQMANAVSYHLSEIEAGRREIENINASLEETVMRRTHELAEKNIELGRTIEHLQETRESLIRSEKMASLGAIVAGVSHEMSTPIGNALIVSSSLREKTRAFEAEVVGGLRRSSLMNFTEECRQAAELIERNLTRAATLVHSFKQVAVDQASEQRRSFDLRVVIQECLVLLQPTLKRTPYQVEAKIPEGIEMESYPGPLGQVITNLVNNAILHGFEGRDQGRVILRAETFGEQGVRLTVHDDGKGIPQEIMGRIFDPFFTTRFGQGGSGLGLHIIFNIVHRLLGGTVDAESPPGQGTTFILNLPRRAPGENFPEDITHA